MIRHGLQRLPAKWFREMFALNPPEIFARLDCPMLLIGGEKDVQCLPGDVQKILETVRGEAEGHVVPNLTHVLRTEEGKPSLLRTAQLLKDPMNPAVLSIIAGWIQKRLRA